MRDSPDSEQRATLFSVEFEKSEMNKSSFRSLGSLCLTLVAGCTGNLLEFFFFSWKFIIDDNYYYYYTCLTVSFPGQPG